MHILPSRGQQWFPSAPTSLSLLIQSCVLDCWLYPDDRQQLAACSGAAPVTAAPAPPPWCPCAGAPAPGHESESTQTFALNPLADTWSLSGSAARPNTLTWDPSRSPVGSSSCSERDPVCAAAHLHLLGESLCLIGLHLRTTDVSSMQRSCMCYCIVVVLCVL